MNWHHRLLPFPSKSRYSSTESTSPYSQSSEFCFTSIKALIFSSHFISTMVTGIRLPYPDNTIGWEIFYMIVYWFITISALFFGLHHITFLNSHFSFSFLFFLFSLSLFLVSFQRKQNFQSEIIDCIYHFNCTYGNLKCIFYCMASLCV